MKDFKKESHKTDENEKKKGKLFFHSPAVDALHHLSVHGRFMSIPDFIRGDGMSGIICCSGDSLSLGKHSSQECISSDIYITHNITLLLIVFEVIETCTFH
jgi:hypothetical protein